jgi:hypothetical protein
MIQMLPLLAKVKKLRQMDKKKVLELKKHVNWQRKKSI